MPKGYVISRVDIKDPEAYARYAEAGTKAIAAHGGKPLARGGRTEALEGRRAQAQRRPGIRQLRRGAGAITIPPNIRPPRRFAKARPTWRSCWWRAPDMAKGYWIAHVDVADRRGLQGLRRGQCRRLRQVWRAVPRARRDHEIVEGTSRARQVGDRVQGLRDRARLLSLAGISGGPDAASRTASPAISSIVEGYDGPQPG